MKGFTRFLSFFILLHFSSIFSQGVQRSAFVSFYNAFGGNGWKNNEGWLKSQNVCDGTWFGISCVNTPIGQTVLLNLTSNGLVGSFPPEISTMPLGALYLTDNLISGPLPEFFGFINAISLGKNRLSGSIPSTYSNYVFLQLFDVSENELTGEIDQNMFRSWSTVLKIDLSSNLFTGDVPSSLGMISNDVQGLYLANNQFTGVIPEGLCTKTNLLELNLAINFISGSIPSCLGNLKSLMSLRLDSNQLNGSIPDELYNCTNLLLLQLNDNQLSGRLSPKLSQLKQLQVFYAHSNRLSGPIPEMDPLLFIFALKLSENQFSGSVPKFLGKNLSMKQLYLSSNRLSGTLPVELFDARNLTTLYLNGNRFSGLFPLQLRQLTLLQVVDISNNLFSGEAPDIFGELTIITKVIANHNNFSGNLPSSFVGFSALTDIDLSYNHFVGGIPNTIQFLTQLSVVKLNNNKLTGAIPSEISFLTQLTEVSLANNLFRGKLPSALGYLTACVSMDMSNNQLVGGIPESVSNMKSLQILNIGNNLFTADNLETLTSLTSLRELDIGNNLIHSPLPSSIGQLVNLNSLDLSYNQIYGQIPDSLYTMRSLAEIKLQGNQLTGTFGSLQSDPSVLDISNNKFFGDLSFVSQLSSIQFLNISFNSFTGGFPSISNLKKIETIVAASNQLNGEVPPLTNLLNLEFLDLSNNQFTGAIPQMTGDVSVQTVKLNGNQFSDASFMTLFPNLTSCDVSGNSFECPVTSQASTRCKAFCTFTLDYKKASVRMRIEGSLSTFNADQFLSSLSKSVETSVSRFSIISTSSGSVIVDLSVSSPNADQIQEGSALRIVDRIKNTEDSVYSANGINIIDISDIPSSSLSKGAIAGIVVGVVVFVALIVGLIAAFLIVRRRRQLEKDYEMINRMDKLLLENVTVENIIGAGQFGEVYKGNWNGTMVALKGLKSQLAAEEAKWREEITLLQKLNHPNVVRLLGVHKMNGTIYMVLEFAENGSLDTFLRKPSTANGLSNNDLLKMVFDMANGMMYLQTRKVIHRDLAARNLLLDGSLHVKISDFGLSKEDDVYQMTSNQIPFRWSAPEMIQHHTSSGMSDVWSFGVVVWEIFTMGAVPYRYLTNKQVVEYVMEGKRLDQPQRCPDEIYSIMLKCWKKDPEARPSFESIRNSIVKAYPDVFKTEFASLNFSASGTTANFTPRSSLLPSEDLSSSFHSAPTYTNKSTGGVYEEVGEELKPDSEVFVCDEFPQKPPIVENLYSFTNEATMKASKGKEEGSSHYEIPKK